MVDRHELAPVAAPAHQDVAAVPVGVVQPDVQHGDPLHLGRGEHRAREVVRRAVVVDELLQRAHLPYKGYPLLRNNIAI